MANLEFQFSEGYGLHARPAGILAQAANKYKSNITVIKEDGTRASAKGLFGLLGLKVEGGNKINVEIDGPDEDMAAATIQKLFDNNFKAPDNDATD